MMEKRELRLRPHHIALFLDDYGNLSDRIASMPIIEKIYGREFAESLENLRKQLTPDTLVQVVSGQDDVCNYCGCPYHEDCKTWNYQTLIEKVRNLPSLPFLDFSKATVKTGETEDAECLKEYDLEVGKVYRMGDMRLQWIRTRYKDFGGLEFGTN